MYTVRLLLYILRDTTQRSLALLPLTFPLLLFFQITSKAQLLANLDQGTSVVTAAPSSVHFGSKADTTVICAKDIPPVAGAIATDNCDPNPTVYFKQKVADSTSVNSFKVIRKWWAKDASGNTSDTITQVITVNDHTKPVTTAVPAPANDPKTATESNEITLRVTVFPNPYNDKLIFRFTAPVTGQVKLEVYNVLGQQIGQLNYGMVDKGTQHTIEYNVPAPFGDVLLYRINVGEHFRTGKVIPAKK